MFYPTDNLSLVPHMLTYNKEDYMTFDLFIVLVRQEHAFIQLLELPRCIA